MAEIIPYQPVEWNGTRDACLHGEVKPMKVNEGDVTQFQFKLEPCGDAQRWTNPFTTSGGNWTVVSQEYCHTAGAAGGLVAMPTLTENVSYFFQLTVSGMTAGSIESRINLFDTLITITQNGVYTFWFTPPATAVYQWALTVTSDFDGCIDEPTFFRIDNNFRFFICDDQSNILATLDKNSGVFKFQRQWLTVDIDWDLYVSTHGCYNITGIDPCINDCSQTRMIGQDFQDDTQWTISTGAGRDWVISGGTASFQATMLGVAEMISLQSLCAGKTYEITYTLANMLNNTFQLNVGGTLGVLRSTNGTFTETITAGGSAAFRLIGDSPAIASDFEVTNLAFEMIDADVTADYVSNTFEYGVHSCTNLINAVNNEDAFGMGFYDTTFNPRVRVECKIFPHTTDQERLIHEDSKGKKFVVWGNNNWIELLRIINEPPHVLKFLSLLPLFNHWYIGLQEYFVNDDEFPEISWTKFRNSGSVDLEIRKKQELIKQQDCTDQNVGGILGDEADLEAQSTGQPIYTTILEKIPVKTQQ